MKKRIHFRPRFNNPLGLKAQSSLKKVFKKWTWKRFFKTAAWTVGLGVIGVLLLFAWYAKDLPTPGKIQKRRPIEATQIFDRNGKPLYAVFGEEKRITISQEDIPDVVKNATIAIEDKDFYKHHGIDISGIIRGVILKPLSGQRAQGGSTITQQYIKNALLSPERTLDRKIKEWILSIELEFMFSKEEILTMYLNEIPYGSNAYGIEAAAETFFGKSANELTLEEASTLAALPQRPTYLSPYGSHTDALKNRRDLVLSKMAELSYITEEEKTNATATEIAVIPRRENIVAPHFVLYVRELLVEKYGEQLVLEGGLRVTTTLDLEAQQAAEEAISRAADRLPRYKATNAALTAVDPRNGQIMAMVGSVDYFDTENDGNFNVATALRQPGSAFKPLVYAAGFKNKWSPSSTLWDVPTDFGNYTPQNYDGNFRGPVTIRAALANSLNIPAVKMLGLVGIDEAIKTAQDFGITSLTDPERYGLSLVLGGAEVRPVELAAAYGVFANYGVYNPTAAILEVKDSKGRVLETWKEQPEKVLPPEAAYEMTHVLIDNEARTPTFGANSPLYFPGRFVAAKTGTTQNYHDAWTVGYTPGLSVAAWVGNNDNTAMTRGGVSAAAPIFHDFIQTYYKDKDSGGFPRPDSIREVAVDALSGKLPTEHSPQVITDIFAPWQVPKEHDDIHVSVKVNKANGKLATDLTPPELIEERVYTRIHSEKPNDPRWEEPVIAWARDHGYELSEPPTEKDDITADQLPSITIATPQKDEAVTGIFPISVNPVAAFGIRSVEYFIDNISVYKQTEGPWGITYDANKLSSGNHQALVILTDQYGATAQASTTLIVTRDQTPPEEVSSAQAQAIPSGKIKISWKNPSNTDLDRIRVYRSTTANQLGTLVEEVRAVPNTPGSVTLDGLSTATTYYFTLRPVDTSGNENKTTKQVSALAL